MKTIYGKIFASLGSSISDIFWSIFKIELFVPMLTADEDYLSFGIDIVMQIDTAWSVHVYTVTQ